VKACLVCTSSPRTLARNLFVRIEDIRESDRLCLCICQLM
jgi:hypothetical protein